MSEQRAAAGMGRTRKAHGLEELLESMEVASQPARAANPAVRPAEQRGDAVSNKRDADSPPGAEDDGSTQNAEREGRFSRVRAIFADLIEREPQLPDHLRESEQEDYRYG